MAATINDSLPFRVQLPKTTRYLAVDESWVERKVLDLTGGGMCTADTARAMLAMGKLRDTGRLRLAGHTFKTKERDHV